MLRMNVVKVWRLNDEDGGCKSLMKADNQPDDSKLIRESKKAKCFLRHLSSFD